VVTGTYLIQQYLELGSKSENKNDMQDASEDVCHMARSGESNEAFLSASETNCGRKDYLTLVRKPSSITTKQTLQPRALPVKT